METAFSGFYRMIFATQKSRATLRDGLPVSHPWHPDDVSRSISDNKHAVRRGTAKTRWGNGKCLCNGARLGMLSPGGSPAQCSVRDMVIRVLLLSRMDICR